MYAVTCPSCDHKESSPFARIGSVMVCQGCKKPVQIGAGNVKRQVKLKTDFQDDLFTVSLVHHHLTADEPHADEHVDSEHSGDEYDSPHADVAYEDDPVHADHDVTHDMGHHEGHDFGHDDGHDTHEAAAALANNQTATQPRRPKRAPRTPKGTDQMSSAVLAATLAKKRKLVTTAWMGAGVLILVVGVVLLVNMMGGGGTSDGNGTGDGQSTDGGGTAVAIDPGNKDGINKDRANKDAGNKDGSSKDGGDKDKSVSPSKDKSVKPDKPVKPVTPKIIRVKAVPLGDLMWNQTNQSFISAGQSGDGPLLLIDTSVSDDVGQNGRWFTGKIVSDKAAIGAVLDIRLVNDEDRVYASFQQTVPMIESKKPRDVRLLIPNQFLAGLATIDWAIAAIDTKIEFPVFLKDGLAQINKEETNPVLNVSALNPSDMTLTKAVFVIQHTADSSTVIKQWRAQYAHPVKSRKWVKFQVELPDDVKIDQGQWRVLAAGIPDPADLAKLKKGVTDGTGPKKPSNGTNNEFTDPGERNLKKDIRNRSIFDF